MTSRLLLPQYRARNLAGLLLVIFTLPLFWHPVVAQEPERTEAFVYATQYYDGLTYSSAMAPPDADTIYLPANVENIIAPRRTLIYYWPLTNRFLPDWNGLNELVQGRLEIYQGNELVSTVELTNYLIQYDAEDPLNTLGLFTGPEAEARNLAFTSLQAQYQRELFQYYQRQQAWRQERDSILRSAEPGTLALDSLPDPPEPIPPFSMFSTDMLTGYPLSLPVGEYRIQLRLDNNEIVPDSQKALIIFDKLRDAISYTVVPENRWTRPEESNDPDSVIYAATGARLYLEPYQMSQYNELHYTRMGNPQDSVARSDRTMPVVFEPYPAKIMRLLSGNRLLAEQPVESYFVQQLPGDSLGYEVMLFDPVTMTESSFDGFTINFSSRNAYDIELVDDNGNPVPGSQRNVRLLNTSRTWLLYVLSILPLIVGLMVNWQRRRTIREVSHEAEYAARIGTHIE